MNQQKGRVNKNNNNKNNAKQNSRKATPNGGSGGGSNNNSTNKKQEPNAMTKKNNGNSNKNKGNGSKKGASDKVIMGESEKVFNPPPKLERSKTFDLFGHKLNKVITKLTGSRESLNKIDDGRHPPLQPDDNRFTLKRSLTLSSISIKRHNRKSFPEPILEELKEDSILDKVESKPISAPVFEPPPFKRSGSFIDRLRRRISGTKSKEGAAEIRNKWSSSLQNLQKIDNMVSYEDMTFVNYDKFNAYYDRVERQMSQTDLSLSRNGSQLDLTVAEPMRRYPSTSSLRSMDPNGSISVRPKKRISFNIEENKVQQFLENPMNEQTQSNHSTFKNEFEYYEFLKNSFKNDSEDTLDVVDSEKVQMCEAPRSFQNIRQKKSLSMANISINELDEELLKSRSLTHLDQLEPHIKHESEAFKEVDTKTERPISKEQSTENEIRPTSAMLKNASSPLVLQHPTVSSAIKKKSSSFLQRGVRKPILTRSQISSSEYFSVCFDTENGFGEKDEVFIPATKGVYLSDSLLPALSSRSLSFTQISIIDNGMHNQFELGIPTYLGPLDGNTDIGTLAGRTLVVTERDGLTRKSHSSLSKAASIGFRSRQSKFFSSASTEEPADDLKTGTKQKQRWSLQLFGIKNPQQNQLCELLNTFTKNGVPQQDSSYVSAEYEEAVEALEKLPLSWSDLVKCADMTEAEIKIQNVIWELVTTEVDYIQGLRTVTDLFLACLKALQMENILSDVNQAKLFSNICEIAEANLKFWTMYLYPMVKNCRLSGQPMRVDDFQNGFVLFSNIFSPYTKYCADQSLCQGYCKELNQNNSLFTAYLAWCESHKMCNRLRLADILVRPMQRLTKYGLLLNAIRKHVIDETDCDQMDSMIRSVDDFLVSVNAHLTARQENERLKAVMARIEAYDVVDTNNEHLDKMVKQYNAMFDLCAPMKGCLAQERHLFLEGDLKYKDNINKLDVHCFLLTDVLLICKATTKKGHGMLKIVRQPYQTDRLQVKNKDNIIYCVYLNEFNLAIAAFTLQCSEAKTWHESLMKARHIYSRLKQGSPWDLMTTNIHLQVKKSPLNSSIGSRVSSLNNSHSGSIELTESRNVSVDFEKTNSMSSDEGSSYVTKTITTAGNKKLKPSTTNSLTIQPYNSLGQSMPNLNIHSQHSSNMLLVPGTSGSSGHSNLLSPSQRGISYPPPSPTRATLRRGFAFSQSIKNPPLVKTRNIQSQSFNLHQHPHLQQSSSFGQYTATSAPITQIGLTQHPTGFPARSGGPNISGQSTPKISRSSSSNETNDT